MHPCPLLFSSSPSRAVGALTSDEVLVIQGALDMASKTADVSDR